MVLNTALEHWKLEKEKKILSWIQSERIVQESSTILIGLKLTIHSTHLGILSNLTKHDIKMALIHVTKHSQMFNFTTQCLK